jgi:hypothetical protein
MDDRNVGPLFDISGRRIKNGRAPQAAEVAAAVRAALDIPAEAGRPTAAPAQPTITGTACFELHPGHPAQIFSSEPAFELNSGPGVIHIQATVDLFTYPYRILAVNLSGNICQLIETEWQVIEGNFGGDEFNGLLLTAERVPLSNQQVAAEEMNFTSCASVFAAVATHHQNPDSYLAVFAFDTWGLWTCNILFKGWQACS